MRKRHKLLIALSAAAVFVGATVAVAAAATGSSSTVYTICYDENGKVSGIAEGDRPARSCKRGDAIVQLSTLPTEGCEEGWVLRLNATGDYECGDTAPEPNSISSSHIRDGQVMNEDLASDAVDSAKVQDNSLTGNDLRDETVTGADLQDGTVTGADIADNSVTGTDITDNSITGTDITDNSVTGADIADNSITADDLAPGVLSDTLVDNLTGDHVVDESLTGDDVQDGSLTGLDIADGSIAGVDIGFDEITNLHLADDSVTGDKVADGSLTGDDIADGTITADDLAPGLLTSTVFAQDGTSDGNGFDNVEDEIVQADLDFSTNSAPHQVLVTAQALIVCGESICSNDPVSWWLELDGTQVSEVAANMFPSTGVGRPTMMTATISWLVVVDPTTATLAMMAESEGDSMIADWAYLSLVDLGPIGAG